MKQTKQSLADLEAIVLESVFGIPGYLISAKVKDVGIIELLFK